MSEELLMESVAIKFIDNRRSRGTGSSRLAPCRSFCNLRALHLASNCYRGVYEKKCIGSTSRNLSHSISSRARRLLSCRSADRSHPQRQCASTALCSPALVYGQ